MFFLVYICLKQARKSSAKVQLIYELCKFFNIKSFQQLIKVVQNKIASDLLLVTCDFQKIKKFSKKKKLSTT